MKRSLVLMIVMFVLSLGIMCLAMAMAANAPLNVDDVGVVCAATLFVGAFLGRSVVRFADSVTSQRNGTAAGH